MSLKKILIVPGMPRTGSTFLYHYLKNHPCFFPPPRKETDYFSTNYKRGQAWFQGLFQGIAPHQFGLDISPSYFMELITIERILKDFEEALLVLGVRHPAHFAASWYLQQKTSRYRFISFEEFLQGWVTDKGDGKVSIYMASGDIRQNIEAWRQAFGRRMLIYSYDSFAESPFRILKAIESFTGVEPWFEPDKFNNRIINELGRANFKPLTFLLTREWMVNRIAGSVPRGLVLKLRRIFDFASRPGRKSSALAKEIADCRATAERVLARDVDYFKRLFTAGDLLLGTGEVFMAKSLEDAV